LILASWAAGAAASDETEVRGAVERIFRQLQTGDYGALYDALPAATQRRVSRERFAERLERTRDLYGLDRIEIGRVRVAGPLAVVDTVIYGRVRRPFESEGKIVAQQYLVREAGRWRVATGDRATVQRFLADHPAFARRFPVRAPKIYIKRDGRWVLLDAASLPRRRAMP
jgi:hypothetical protein